MILRLLGDWLDCEPHETCVGFTIRPADLHGETAVLHLNPFAFFGESPRIEITEQVFTFDRDVLPDLSILSIPDTDRHVVPAIG